MKMDRLPGAVKLAADSMEISSQELMKMMENNQLLAEEFLPKFATAMRESVREGDALNKMMQSTQSQMGRFGNSVNDAALAFSRGGFNKAFLEFLAQATKSMNAMISSGFFDALGFGFRMLVMPIRAVMEIVEGLNGIFKKAADEGGEYRDILTKIAVVLGVLLLPALLSVGRALAPFLLMTAGLLALGDIMEGLAGNSSEFSDNWAKLTESFKNGKTDWEAFTKVATELGIALAGILATTVALRKLNPFKGKASTIAAGGAATAAAGGSGFVSKALRFVSKAVRSPIMALQSDKLGEGSDQIYDANGNVKAGFKEFTDKQAIDIAEQERLRSARKDVFNQRMLELDDSLNIRSRVPVSNEPASSQSVIISNMNINGESAPENLRTNMESYMNNLLGDVFTDAMRETVR